MPCPQQERAEFELLPPKAEAPLNESRQIVEVTSSSEKSTTSEEAGEEATSSAHVSPNGKRPAPADLSTLTASAENSRKMPRLSDECKAEISDPAAGMSREEEKDAFDLPADFLEPLEPEDIPFEEFALDLPHSSSPRSAQGASGEVVERISRQFRKAGDYDSFEADRKYVAGGMDHVRVHPKFLHSNATSYKWALGAIAELLDNALDEFVNGARRASIDIIHHPRDGSPMLVIEDNGGGMSPERLRQCMSFGYSAKSKIANTIGQYGNGFKTSTMRLGADVIVFSRCPGKGEAWPTQSVGMLSYTFLTATGQEDIIVPMIDYEVQPFGLRKHIRGNVEDWNKNLETILQWCPYTTEKELIDQLHRIDHQGTIVIVYHLWEDEQGEKELDFETDRHDIQLRGTNRDDRNISMANKYPNCKHYFTYRYSLRSYVSILYLRLPVGFKIILRSEEVCHHNLAHDLMLTEKLTYRPQSRTEQTLNDYRQMVAVVTIGFLKDAREHIDVQGFNVYHKNRLIKPFWRVWNIPGIQGRGIVGVLEANFVEPAHDKQDFERTGILARLEARLVEIQKKYWAKNCQEVGYGILSLRRTGKSASNMGSDGEDRSMERFNQASTELRVPPAHHVDPRASNSSNSAIQRQLHAPASKTREALINPVPHVPPRPISLAPKGLAQSHSNAQPHPRTGSKDTVTAHESAVPVDRLKPPQTCSAMPALVTRPLRPPMLRTPVTANHNHAVIGQARAAPTPKTELSTHKRISVDQGPVSVSAISRTSSSQESSLPTELSTIDVPMVEPENSQKKIHSRLDPTVLATAAKSSICQSRPQIAPANSLTRILQPLQSKSPVGSTATGIPLVPSTVPEKRQPPLNAPLMQTSTLVNPDQGSATARLRAELEEIQTTVGTAGHVAELNTLLQTSATKANASTAASRMPEADHQGILDGSESSSELKAKVKILKQKVTSLHRDLEQVTKERDSLKAELENERKKKIFEDEKLQKALQALFLRARKLEDQKTQAGILPH